jgi:uncharacterized protein YodC (DUF2158 family)
MMNFQQAAIETLGEEPQFDIADVVQLVSGGPPMTVTGWKGVMIHCEWFVRSPDGKSWLPDLYEPVGELEERLGRIEQSLDLLRTEKTTASSLAQWQLLP